MAGYKIDDPYFSEFVFHCISTASKKELSRIPFGFDQYARTPSSIKRFAETASLELRLVMLGRLGIDWKLWLSPREGMNKKIMIETLEKYKDDSRLDSVNRMIGEKHFVFGDRDIMTILSMMSQNCHSQTYRINREYSRIADNIVDAAETNNSRSMKSAIEDHKVVLGFAHQILMHDEFFDGEFVFRLIDLQLLQYFMLNRNTFIELKQILKHFSQYTKNTLSTCLLKLFKSGHIDKFPAKRRYCIANLGVQVMDNYHKRILDRTINQ